MLDIKEKLVELFYDNNVRCDQKIEGLVDDVMDIIANGVTVQEWISVKDRLPTIYDADADNCVLAIHKASNKRYCHWQSVADNPFDFTHWMKTPKPPKGE